MRVVIADDEAPSRRRLKRMLLALPDLEVVGEAANGEQALQLSRSATPDVLFLDIRMPGMDGVTLVRTHGDLPPVVFVTAYDAHAIEAFELHAVDYLLKPVRPERLAQAVERVRQRKTAGPPNVTQALNAVQPATTRVVSATRGVIRLFDALDITRFWAADKYTLFLVEGKEHLTDESLVDLEQRLASHHFLRVHRGELVNLKRVSTLRTDAGIHTLELTDGQRVRVSRRSLPAVKQQLGL